MQVKTKQTMVIALFVLLIGAIWYQYVFSPSQSAISDANAKTADATSQAKIQRAQLNGPTSHSKKSNTGQITSDQLQAAVPDDPKMTDLLRQLEALRVKDGVGWSTITPSLGTMQGKVMSTNIGITVGGSYPAVHNFVDDVLSMPRLALIDNISWTPGAPAGTASSATPAGASASGPPTGHIFGAPGGTPSMTVQMTVRVFNALGGPAVGATGGSTSGSSSPASGSSSTPPGQQNS